MSVTSGDRSPWWISGLEFSRSQVADLHGTIRIGMALPVRFNPGTPAETVVHRISKMLGEEFLTLDLLVVGLASELARSGRLLLDWNGQVMPVVSREGLLQMKRAAGRLQDLLDIEKLEHPDD